MKGSSSLLCGMFYPGIVEIVLSSATSQAIRPVYIVNECAGVTDTLTAHQDINSASFYIYKEHCMLYYRCVAVIGIGVRWEGMR